MGDPDCCALRLLKDGLVECMSGSRSDNMELALRSFESALTAFTKDKQFELWARAQLGRGVTYQSRMEGDNDKNIDQSIQIYLEIIDQAAKNKEYQVQAKACVKLAKAYIERTIEDLVENLERAVTLTGLAVSLLSEQEEPLEWARAHVVRGLAYNDRKGGDRQENLQLALQSFSYAERYITLSSHPAEWGGIQLGKTDSYRSYTGDEHHLEKALECGFAAREGLDPFEHVYESGRVELLLGCTYCSVQMPNGQNLELAKEHFEAALEVFHEKGAPSEWSTLQRNLASVFANRLHGDPDENLQRSLRRF